MLTILVKLLPIPISMLWQEVLPFQQWPFTLWISVSRFLQIPPQRRYSCITWNRH